MEAADAGSPGGGTRQWRNVLSGDARCGTVGIARQGDSKRGEKARTVAVMAQDPKGTHFSPRGLGLSGGCTSISDCGRAGIRQQQLYLLGPISFPRLPPNAAVSL